MASVVCNLTRPVEPSVPLSSPPQSSLTIKCDSFHGSIRNDRMALGYLEGDLLATNKKTKSSGKIDPEAAEKTSLRRPIKEHEKKSENVNTDEETDPPEMDFTAYSSIKLETLSWMGRIKQKYGFTD